MNAFPIPELIQDRNGDYSLHCEGGLTKRELFAAMAMQGMLSNPAICDMTSGEASQVALWANQCADALLTELAKESAQGGKSYD